MEQLTVQHEKLLEISQNKRKAIRESNTDSLVKLLTEERQLVQKLERLELARSQVVNQYVTEQGIEKNDITISEVLELVQDQELRWTLEKLVAGLIDLIVELRESEQLNKELLQQSMQFVQLSLDMIQPQAENISYGEKAKLKRTNINDKKSIFDSKV